MRKFNIMLVGLVGWTAAFLFSGTDRLLWAAEASDLDAQQSQEEESKGFKIGKLRLHPALTVQNIFDTNVTNASSHYADNPSARGASRDVWMDDILHVLGGFKLNYPTESVAVSFGGNVGYSRYFGIDNSDTTKMSSITGQARLVVNVFPKRVVNFAFGDTFTRTADPQQVGIVKTSDRFHNLAGVHLGIRPGGGQLRLFVGYQNALEYYDASLMGNLNYMNHTAWHTGELEFFPKTAFFWNVNFTYRDYFKFDPDRDARMTDSVSPNAMPLNVSVGLMGRVTAKLILNISAGYGNTFSSHLSDPTVPVIGKVELSGQFTTRTLLKGGFERSIDPIVTYGNQVNNKIYLDFRQWFVQDKIKLNLYSAFSIFEYGDPDKGVDLWMDPHLVYPATAIDVYEDAYGVGWRPTQAQFDAASRRVPLGQRSDMMLSVTPSFRYDPLKWLFIEFGYTLSWRITDYKVTRYYPVREDPLSITDSKAQEVTGAQTTYYDYLKHEIFLKLTLSY